MYHLINSVYCVFILLAIYLLSLESKVHEGRDFCLFHSLLYLQYLAQFLAHWKNSISMWWLIEQLTDSFTYVQQPEQVYWRHFSVWSICSCSSLVCIEWWNSQFVLSPTCVPLVEFSGPVLWFGLQYFKTQRHSQDPQVPNGLMLPCLP